MYRHDSTDRRFYVYTHNDENGTIRFIGTGCSNNLKTRSGRSSEHLEVWDSLSKTVYKENLTKIEAIDFANKLFSEVDCSILFNKIHKSRKVLSIEYNYISKFFEYNEDSPSCLSWKIKPSKPISAGDFIVSRTRSKSEKDYYKLQLEGVVYRVHRIIYCLKTEEDLPENLVIDHINGNSLDNRFENLRLVRHIDNNNNLSLRESNTSGINGINWDKDRCRWIVGWCDNLKYKVKHFNPEKLYPHIDQELAKQQTLILAKQFKESLYNWEAACKR